MATNKENPSPAMEMEDHEDPMIPSFFDCFCFRGVICCTARRRTPNIGDGGGGGGSDRRLLDEDKAELAAAVGREDAWWVEKLKAVKEMSEILAGPKWKNFIRKFSSSNKKRRSSMLQYHYDPASYALNFYDGIDRDNGVFPDFAARYAAAGGAAAAVS